MKNWHYRGLCKEDKKMLRKKAYFITDICLISTYICLFTQATQKRVFLETIRENVGCHDLHVTFLFGIF
jgi:hypothetical protein